VGTAVRVTRWVTHTHMGMGMGVNPYPLVYMGDPMWLFLFREYGYEVLISDGYLSIAISNGVGFLFPISAPVSLCVAGWLAGSTAWMDGCT
jgi:hypothetical protein